MPSATIGSAGVFLARSGDPLPDALSGGCRWPPPLPSHSAHGEPGAGRHAVLAGFATPPENQAAAVRSRQRALMRA